MTARDAVIAALVAGTDPAKTIGELCAATRLPRTAVEREINQLAAEQRVIRALTDREGVLVVRWTLKR